MVIHCQRGRATPAIGSRGVIPAMRVMSDWNRLRLSSADATVDATTNKGKSTTADLILVSRN